MKYVVGIVVPAVDKTFDILVPDFLTISELVCLCGKAVEQMTEQQFIASGNEILIQKNNGKFVILNASESIEHSGICNGQLLYLF